MKIVPNSCLLHIERAAQKGMEVPSREMWESLMCNVAPGMDVQVERAGNWRKLEGRS